MVRRLMTGAFVLSCLTAFALGGAALAGAFGDHRGGPLSAEDAVRAGSAAVRAAGDGKVLSVERTDDGGATWDVDVLRDGQEIEVLLDANLDVVHAEHAWQSVAPPAARFDEADARRLSPDQARRAGEAAVHVAGGGSVESVERSDDPGEAYEIEVVRPGHEIDVALDEHFRPVHNMRYDDD